MRTTFSRQNSGVRFVAWL